MKNFRSELAQLKLGIQLELQKITESDFNQRFDFAVNSGEGLEYANLDDEALLEELIEVGALTDLHCMDVTMPNGRAKELHILNVCSGGIYGVDANDSETHLFHLKDIISVYDRITILEEILKVIKEGYVRCEFEEGDFYLKKDEEKKCIDIFDEQENLIMSYFETVDMGFTEGINYGALLATVNSNISSHFNDLD